MGRPTGRAALLLFGLLVLTQSAHLLEHAVQVVQVHVLDRSGDAAGGLLWFLDVEWVHFVWNTWILVATVPLVLRHRDVRWLWLALVAAVVHEIEHAWLILRYVHTGGLPDDPGLLASGGAIAGGTPLARVDLHLLYNALEVLPLVIAFVVVLRRRRADRPADDALPGVARPLAWSTLAGVLGSAGLIGVAAVTAPADHVGDVLTAYARDFPLALAAPEWVPDGFHLVDGDGPWTVLDQDGDGVFETRRAELMYAPARHRGVPPLMLSVESQKDLTPLAAGYERVVLPDGRQAWLSVTADSPWVGLLWNRDGLTMGIQARDLSLEELLRVAASMSLVDEAAGSATS